MAAEPATATPTSVAIYPGTQFQTVEGWGTSLAWWAEGSGGWADPQRQALANAIFDPTTGLGLNVVRYNIGATTPTDTCASLMRVGAAVPSFERSSGSYDWTQDANQRWMLQAAQARGANIFEGVSYSAPAWMTLNNCSAGANTAGADNLASTQYASYAQYLATVTAHFHDTWGIPFRTIDPFNEPVQTPWGASKCSPTAVPKCQQGMNVGTTAQNAIIPQLQTQLVNSGMAAYTGIAASDEFSTPGTISNYNTYNSTSQSDVAQLNTHDYAAADGNPLYALGQKQHKRVSMSEWGSDGPLTNQISAAVTLSQHILTNEQQQHPSTWVIWQAVDGPIDGGNINDLWGLVWADYSPNGNGQLTFPKRYYAMGNYSKFIRPGYKMIQNTDPNTFTAYDAGSGRLVIVATNPSSSQTQTTYDLSNFAGTAASAAGYRTSATEDLTSISATPIASSQLTVTLPAQSITTYVVGQTNYTGPNAMTQVDDATQGTGTNQWNYVGTGWQHCSGTACGDPQNLYAGTTSWDGVTNDKATTSFTGTRIRLYGITDTNEGIAQVSIDGGPATDVDFYSAQRHGNQLVWASLGLTPGTHTLSLVVTGRKNPLSTNYWPAIDLAEVEPSATPATGSLVASRTTGSIRNNFTGTVGMKFTTGTSGLHVTSLGREYVTGNTGTHSVSIYRASDSALVGTASVATANATIDGLGYQYATLTQPVDLAANTSYYLASSETNGGDYWFDLDSQVTLGSGVSADGPAYLSGGAWTAYTWLPGQTYGPVNLLHS
jgi:O-glycosyl hydrolase